MFEFIIGAGIGFVAGGILGTVLTAMMVAQKYNESSYRNCKECRGCLGCSKLDNDL